MYNQRTRYCTTIFALDRINYQFNIAGWDKDTYEDIVSEQHIHTGLFLIDNKKALSIRIEYLNIIWDYKVFFGSCKKKYKKLEDNDERWKTIEECLYDDLKRMGLEELYDDVITHLKNNEYYEFNEKRDVQFKKYCIIEEE